MLGRGARATSASTSRGADDAGALPAAHRVASGGARAGPRSATVDRYLGPHEIVLLGEDLAAIAPRARGSRSS